jgi:hypothetical protein
VTFKLSHRRAASALQQGVNPEDVALHHEKIIAYCAKPVHSQRHELTNNFLVASVLATFFPKSFRRLL